MDVLLKKYYFFYEIFKHLSTALLIAIFGLFCLPVVSQDFTGDIAEDIARIQRSGVLKVSVINEYSPPFIMTQLDGSVSGFDIEFARLLADNLGVKFHLYRKANSYNGVIDSINRREADIAISTLSKTLSRIKYVSFSIPYLRLRPAILVNRLEMARLQLEKEHVSKGLINILPSSHIENVAIAVVKGSSYEEFAQHLFKDTKITALTFPSWEMAVKQALQGKAFAAFYDNLEVQSYLQKNAQDGLYLQPIIMKNQIDEIAVAVHPDDQQLLQWTNFFIQTAQQDGTLFRLKTKYSLGKQINNGN